MEGLIREFFARMGTRAQLETADGRKTVQAVQLPVNQSAKPEFSLLGQIPKSGFACYLPGNAGAVAEAVLTFGDKAYRILQVFPIYAGGESPLYLQCFCTAVEDSL